MATFMDLPKDVRETIYRLHLVCDKPITNGKHHKIVQHTGAAGNRKSMPPLFRVSTKIEKEASPIYYGENHFDLQDVGDFHQNCKFFTVTPQRHLKFVRKVTCTWASTSSRSWWPTITTYGGHGMVGENWRRISRLRCLEELNIRVDEAEIIKCMTIGREVRQQPPDTDNGGLTPQQSLSIFRFPGVPGLLSISGVKNVEFSEMRKENGEGYGGPVRGGPLETHILPRLRTSPLPPKRFVKKRPFRFLDLPAELRNRVYDLILRIPGPIHPSKEKPTTAPKDESSPKLNESKHCESALSLLLVNKQINEEALGLFYNANAFIFYYPIQLQAFLMSIGPQRQRLLRDLTVDYYNMKCGGIDMIDLAFPLLKQLPGLRRFHVVMKSQLHETNLRRGWLHRSLYGWKARLGVNLFDANPNTIPGVKHLFDLRGLTDIKLRDVQLEKKIEELKKDAAYPDFPASKDNRNIVQIFRALEHFNLALAAAQEGNVNQEILESRDWHTKETFPELKVADEDENEGKEDEGNASGDDSSELSEIDSDYDFVW